MHFEMLNLQIITRAPLVTSNAPTIVAFPKDGFATERTTAVATRTRPTPPAQVRRTQAPSHRSVPETVAVLLDVWR